MYYIYIIRCKNNALYTGITTDIERRMREHCEKRGKGAKFTRANPPKSIEALWSCESRKDASRLEAHIKKLKKSEKENIISDKSFSFEEFEFFKRETTPEGIFFE